MQAGRARSVLWRALATTAALSTLALPGAALAKHAAHKTHHAVAKPAHAARASRVEEPAGPLESVSLKPLSAKDVRAYSETFAAIRAGQFDAADARLKTVSDPVLKGQALYAKLMHPDYAARCDELADWLDTYRDQPGADRVYTLARKRRPGAALSLAPPEAAAVVATADPTWARVEALAERFEAAAPAPAPTRVALPAAPVRDAALPKINVDRVMQASREAFYGGQVQKAYTLAVQAGERWIAGLAAYRLKNFDEARDRFAALATDSTQDEWVRSGAAYWAGRAAIANGEAETAPAFLQLAARTPYTFYGLIAERLLGLEPGVRADGLDPALAPPPGAGAARAPSAVASPSGAGVARLMASDKRARRAAALTQIGMKAEAGAELRAALLGAGAAARQGWMRLGLALNTPLTSSSDLTRPRATRFDIAQYPMPELAPQGGFTLDRALVYALVRQESRFNPNATSNAGAYGLMQLMPETAARVAGDDKLKGDPSLLKDPAINLRLGQDYVTRLLGALNGDLLHAVAAYNSGPGVIEKTLARMGKDTDSLLAVESMPGGQTREFVEKVVAGYWIYRNLLGQTSPSLDAAASGAKAISAALDKPLTPSTTARLGAEAVGALLTPVAAE